MSFAERAPAEVPAWAQEVRKVTVLTGAGVSTDSGIPDFRGPQGVWTRNPGAQQLSTYQAYVGDPQVRRRSWQARRNHPAWTAEPNAAHVALAELACSRVDTHVITQNIDGLHQKAGSPAARVIEVHGSMSSVVCVSCGDRSPMAGALARVDAGEEDPACGRCGGILKSATVMFGQRLDPVVFARAEQAALDCDLFLAIGTTLSVEPAQGRRGCGRGGGDRQRGSHPVRRIGRRGHPGADRHRGAADHAATVGCGPLSARLTATRWPPGSSGSPR